MRTERADRGWGGRIVGGLTVLVGIVLTSLTNDPDNLLTFIYLPTSPAHSVSTLSTKRVSKRTVPSRNSTFVPDPKVRACSLFVPTITWNKHGTLHSRGMHDAARSGRWRRSSRRRRWRAHGPQRTCPASMEALGRRNAGPVRADGAAPVDRRASGRLSPGDWSGRQQSPSTRGRCESAAARRLPLPSTQLCVLEQ